MANANLKMNIETLFEGKPIELEFVKQAINEKTERIEKERGKGCPANNTKCNCLWKDVCIHPLPDISVVDGKTCCASML